MPRIPKPTDETALPKKPKRAAAAKPNGATNGAISSDDIAMKAYTLYQSRGGEHGLDFDDWIEAERQLKEMHLQQVPAGDRRKRARSVSA
jgi:Protein of unknown function (DUF2934)